MKKSDATPFLKDERAKTDDSLITERGKTDESLLRFIKNAEGETDQRIRSDRDEADEERASRRSKNDSTQKSESKSENSSMDQKRSDRQQTQRKLDDETVQAERALMDAALSKERSVKRTVADELFQGEREQTDDNLLDERKETDSRVQQASILLNDEQSSHLLTKASLTTRDEFLAIVSHDLKNPMGSVLSYADLLLEESEGFGFSIEAKNWIEVIKRNALIALQLIDDIVDTERFAAGKFHLEPRKNELIKLIDQTVESFSLSATAKKISLTIEPAAFSTVVNCDRARIEQVLSNLLANAIKFTPAGGTITLSLKERAAEIVVSVADSGKGVPKGEELRIFERFAQINDKDRNGLGLGLYISRMIVEAHQGLLWVTARQPQGSVFSFTLKRST